MAGENNELLEILLRECQAASPQPWYPSEYAQQTGVVRATIEADLDRLRLAGYLRLSDWVKGKGQGYLLTPEGGQVLENPRLLKRLRTAGAEPMPAPAPLQAVPSGVTTYERGEAVRAALLQTTRPTVTITIIFLNIIVFLYGCVLASQQKVELNIFVWSGSPKIAHETGAVLRGDIVLGHEWWRLLTCCFVHFGLLHLGVNMYSLYVVGPLLERMWGTWRFLLLYLITGLAGSCAMVMLADARTVGAGASGALWGLMASMVTWILLNRRFLPGPLAATWLRQLAFIFLINVAITFGVPNISASAHFGGGIAGLVLPVPLEYVRYGRGWQRLASALGIVAVPVVYFGLMLNSFSDAERSQSLRVQAQGILVAAEEMSHGVYKDQVIRLLNQKGEDIFKDKEAVRAAVDEMSKAQEKLKTAEKKLQQLTFADPEMQKALETGIEFVASWSAYYESWIKILNRGNPPTAQEIESLQNQFRAAGLLGRRLAQSPLFKS